MARRGYQNIITTDLVDDPMLTDDNIKTFKKASKELYDFTLVRHDYSSASIRCRVACLNLPLMQNVIKHSQKKTKKLKAVVSGHQELAAKDKRISEELTKNIYLRRELDKLKQEQTREMWLLKNNLRNLEEQLKEQKKAHRGKPLLPSSIST
jgi:small-conductance mechanosensitive channel